MPDHPPAPEGGNRHQQIAQALLADLFHHRDVQSRPPSAGAPEQMLEQGRAVRQGEGSERRRQAQHRQHRPGGGGSNPSDRQRQPGQQGDQATPGADRGAEPELKGPQMPGDSLHRQAFLNR